MVNLKDLRVRVKEIEKVCNLKNYEVMQRFMFERFLARLSISNYNRKLIIKGGLFLSIVFGIHNRSTTDIDGSIIGVDCNITDIENMLFEIININLNDNVKLKLLDIKDTRGNELYGGFNCNLVGTIENVNVNFSIDISTGDIITPSSIELEYSLLFDNKSISIMTYSNETVIAEKLETILKRGIYNSRMKDYVDMYYYLFTFKNIINDDNLHKAIINTFTNRKSLDYLTDYNSIINTIISNNKINELYNKYIKSNNIIEAPNLSILLEEIREVLKKVC